MMQASFVGASLLANRSAANSFASKLAPTVGVCAIQRRGGSERPVQEPSSHNPLAFVGASLLANRSAEDSFASKLAPTVECPVGSRLRR